MNKQEAIKYFKAKKDKYIVPPSDIRVSIAEVIDVISQIHEPQKVVVPKFVAEWIEDMKNAKTEFFEAQSNCMSDEVDDWYYNHADDLLRAWLDDYEIEQEKLYTVEIPDPNRPDIATFLYKENGKVFIGSDIFLDEVPNYKWKKEPENQLTEVEIKEDFEWAWQFAKEVE
ncbi:TPA: DUF1642 domain-containing protein [Streptococcus suis]